VEKLIPYSVHLPPALHKKLKAAAKDRKASGLVRDALTAMLENRGQYEQGYEAGLLAALEAVKVHPLLHSLQWQGESMSEIVERLLEAERG